MYQFVAAKLGVFHSRCIPVGESVARKRFLVGISKTGVDPGNETELIRTHKQQNLLQQIQIIQRMLGAERRFNG